MFFLYAYPYICIFGIALYLFFSDYLSKEKYSTIIKIICVVFFFLNIIYLLPKGLGAFNIEDREMIYTLIGGQVTLWWTALGMSGANKKGDLIAIHILIIVCLVGAIFSTLSFLENSLQSQEDFDFMYFNETISNFSTGLWYWLIATTSLGIGGFIQYIYRNDQ